MYWRVFAVLAAAVSLWLPSTAVAGRTLDVSPHNIKFGKQPFHQLSKRSFTITNVGQRAGRRVDRARLHP